MPQRLDESAKGVFVIAPTPFTEAGALDEASAERMTDAFLAAGASGLTLLGTDGPRVRYGFLGAAARPIAQVTALAPVRDITVREPDTEATIRRIYDSPLTDRTRQK